MKKRKICVVITARPSYSRVKTALTAIMEHPNLELQVVLAGSALLDKYGSIEKNVIEDGFPITEKVYMLMEGENRTSMAKTTGLSLLEFANIFYNLQPDVVLVIADRYETISVAIAAAYQNIPLAHVQGGEITGNIDEKVRHANTKLADIHFVASENAKKRVLRLGEDDAYVFNTGCPSIDLASEILKLPELNFNPYEKYGGVGQKPDFSQGYMVVMQHSVTTEYEKAKQQILQTLMAVKKINLPTFWFWPNADAGADGISNSIRSFREHYELNNIHFFKNMTPEDFLRLLYNSKCLIGNSSVGVRECAYMGVPVINIGTRQQGRDRGNNVVDVDYNEKEIFSAINQSLKDKRPLSSNVYGGGDAGKKIAQILGDIKLRYHKKINF